MGNDTIVPRCTTQRGEALTVSSLRGSLRVVRLHRLVISTFVGAGALGDWHYIMTSAIGAGNPAINWGRMCIYILRLLYICRRSAGEILCYLLRKRKEKCTAGVGATDGRDVISGSEASDGRDVIFGSGASDRRDVIFGSEASDDGRRKKNGRASVACRTTSFHYGRRNFPLWPGAELSIMDTNFYKKEKKINNK